MKRLLLSVVLLTWSVAAWAIAPCCGVTAVNAKTGVVTIKELKTGKVIQYNAAPISDAVVQNKAQPVGIQGLRVGDAVDLVGGELHTASGATIRPHTAIAARISSTRKTMKRLLFVVLGLSLHRL